MPAEEDIDTIVQSAFFAGVTNGVMVEVGAASPDYLSISEQFRKSGWKIIAIEPNPQFVAKHIARGYKVLQYACGDEDKEDVEFFVVNAQGVEYLGGTVTAESFSSLGIKDEFVGLFDRVKDKSTVTSIRVTMRRLDTILAVHEPELKFIDLLAIDVEGWEIAVMRGFSIDAYKPKVVILENLFSKPEYDEYMRAHDYQLWLRLNHNEIYVRRDQVTTGKRIRAAMLASLQRVKGFRRKVGRILTLGFSGTNR
jgi:FkbM family methyltransferase